MLTIIVHRSPTQSTQLLWDTFTEAGDPLTTNSQYPFQDGAYALLKTRVDPNTLVTMQHEHLPYPSFIPLPLHKAAKPALTRAEGRARLAALREAKETAP